MKTPKPNPKDHCPVCGRRVRPPARDCRCPWDKPFESWPERLRATLRAAVRNAPRDPKR